MSNQKPSSVKHQTIVLTGGGSGGHITPILSLAHELKKLDSSLRLVYIGGKGDKIGETHIFDKVYKISAGKFRRYHGESLISHLADIKTILLNIRDLFRVIASIFKSLGLLGRERPTLVFSKGSFVAVPVGLAARFKNIPIITHDSDVIPGLANRIIGKHALIHATGMPAEFYSYPKDKTVFTGIPVSSEIKPVTREIQSGYKAQLGVKPEHQVLLIAGGGNGSVTINNLVIASANQLLIDNPNLYIFHQTGIAHRDRVEQEYKSVLDEAMLHRVKALGFIDDYYKYVGAAELIVSRAGASTIAEYAVMGKPAIIMPSPFLAGGHQLKNAKELEKIDAAVILDDQATADELLVVVNELLHDPARRTKLAKNIGRLAKHDAAEVLAKIIYDNLRGAGN